jgi:hypothetical protein
MPINLNKTVGQPNNQSETETVIGGVRLVMRIRFPLEVVPSFSLTFGFFQAIKYPTGKPWYRESSRFRTLVASQTKGRWISGMAISPDLTQVRMVSTGCGVTEYLCVDICPP